MSMIYEPRGRAREYAPLAANLYRGCGHACRYCYAPAATYQERQAFYAAPRVRPDVIRQLRREAPAYAGQQVLLCFTCDPYQPLDDVHQLTRQAIQALHAGGVGVSLLTKGGRRAERDFDLLGAADQVGASLTLLDAADSREWEPQAALPAERLAMLQAAKARGLRTWASLEPVIDPAQTLALIDRCHAYVDLFKVGRLNYHAAAKAVDWTAFARQVVARLQGYQAAYVLKSELAAALRTAG